MLHSTDELQNCELNSLKFSSCFHEYVVVVEAACCNTPVVRNCRGVQILTNVRRWEMAASVACVTDCAPMSTARTLAAVRSATEWLPTGAPVKVRGATFVLSFCVVSLKLEKKGEDREQPTVNLTSLTG